MSHTWTGLISVDQATKELSHSAGSSGTTTMKTVFDGWMNEFRALVSTAVSPFESRVDEKGIAFLSNRQLE